jgi:hypothetical protein
MATVVTCPTPSCRGFRERADQETREEHTPAKLAYVGRSRVNRLRRAGRHHFAKEQAGENDRDDEPCEPQTLANRHDQVGRRHRDGRRP